VLLKNERGALPLAAKNLRRVVLVGPHANASEHLLGNYYGRPGRLVTPLQAFQARAHLHPTHSLAPRTRVLSLHGRMRVHAAGKGVA
jgi:beta-glucosidase-like glycosyl hydrolase